MAMIWAILAGMLTGILSGMGVGGGTLLMIYLTTLTKTPVSGAKGINLLYFLPCSAAALFSHIKNKLVNKLAAVPAIITGSAATLIASLLVSGSDNGAAKRIFGGFLTAIGLLELFRK